ncbi:MAG: hypothetical protein ACNA8H_10690 [Anaerolineales bacterium]
MNKKNQSLILLVSFAMILFGVESTRADEEAELDLNMRRDFGYGFGADIQGTFSLRVSSSAELTRVVFFIDDETLAEINEPPFRVQFQTSNYDPGLHTLHAIGFTQEGKEIHSRQIRANFLSAEDARSSFLRILIPILGLILGITILGFVGPFLLGRGKSAKKSPDTKRSYGVFGGTICSRCKQPYAIQGWGPNLIAGKLNRCPHCGKWGLVRRANPTDLALAEAEQIDHEDISLQTDSISEEERLRKEIFDSRYRDL